MLLLDIKDAIAVIPGLTRKEFTIRCYATEIFEKLVDSKNLIIFDDAEKLGNITENSLLLGLWDWEMYSDIGNSLATNDDITMRFFGKRGLTPGEINILTGGKNLLLFQIEALKKAAEFILNTLKEIGYERVTITT